MVLAIQNTVRGFFFNVSIEMKFLTRFSTHPSDIGRSFSNGFDQTTVRGFLLTAVMQYHGCISYNIDMSVTITFFISACYYLRACCTEFERNFIAIDKIIMAGRNTKACAAQVEKRIKYAVLFHIRLTK